MTLHHSPRLLLATCLLVHLIRPPADASALLAPNSFKSRSPFLGGARRRSPNREWHRAETTSLFSAAAPINGAAKIEVSSSPASLADGKDANHDGPGAGEEDDPFTLLSSLAAATLLQSDRRRDAVGKESGAQASSATNWIDEGSAFALRKALDKLKLFAPGEDDDGIVPAAKADGRERRDEAIAWLRWMRSIPAPMIVDLSGEARAAADGTVSDDFLKLLDAASSETETKTPGPSKMRRLRADFLDRLQCRLVLLPSGRSMKGGLFEPAGSLTFGKLLYGGVTRYRVLPSSGDGGGDDGKPRPPRRAGERTERKTSGSERVPSWAQYGGAERRYEAVDMGPAMVLEWSLLPKIRGGEGSAVDDGDARRGARGDMTLRKITWSPRSMFRYVGEGRGSKDDGKGNGDVATNLGASMTLQGKDRNDAFASDFRARVGGLGPQIESIVRRVLDGRVIRPAEADGDGNMLSYEEARELASSDAVGGNGDDGGLSPDATSKQLSLAALEAEELALLGLTPVRGLLLYGPPGCGKTALAREIARALRARKPKIVSAPELLDRWVGGSERLVRELFHDAEAELASVNGDASRSALHVIVVDEIDATFRKRSAAEDSGEATRSSAVNQILAKLDGVEAIPNVLMIGMTNRRELLDEALLRPGRLEVQIEIPLPDAAGRREILNIHFAALRKGGRLSRPLCDAIDGTGGGPGDDGPVDAASTPDPTRGRKRRALRRATDGVIGHLSPGRRAGFDLADDAVTGGFSGADLEGLVRCAGSMALSRARKEGAGVESLLITLDDVRRALVEVKV